jgi:hypothetical protein
MADTKAFNGEHQLSTIELKMSTYNQKKKLLLPPTRMSSALQKSITLSGTSYITGIDNEGGTSYVYWENPICLGWRITKKI